MIQRREQRVFKPKNYAVWDLIRKVNIQPRTSFDEAIQCAKHEAARRGYNVVVAEQRDARQGEVKWTVTPNGDVLPGFAASAR